MSAPAIRNDRARALQGTRAGFASRAIANGIDWAMAMIMYGSGLVAYALAVYFVTDHPFHVPDPGLTFAVSLPWIVIVLYLTAGWGVTGQTIGKSVMGLRVIRASGETMRPRRAFVRALICATFPWVLLWVIVSRRNSGVHDGICRTTVVHDWSRAT
ncbi:MAG TPA: RDD family protein [Acidimicrobiia bacterium]|nr:RDD family protein [Acidimicrobiia bacterium]